MSSSSPSDLYDLTLTSHLIIEHFLLSQNYTSTAAALRTEAAASGLTLPPLPPHPDSSLDLRHLVESYRSHRSAEERAQKAAQLAATHAVKAIVDPLTQALPGPATLPFKLEKTHAELHASNILSIARLTLPKRIFDTGQAKYVNSIQECLVTTAADKRIVFSNPHTGEVEEILEHKSGHQAAVLSVAQDPLDPRCLISSGMDGRVVAWDLLTRKPIQVLTEHTKFVVKVVCSPTGEYVASIGYDKKLIIYKRTHQTTFGVEEGEEEVEVEDLKSGRYVKVWEMETQQNPEAILFVRAGMQPSEEVEGVEAGGRGEVVVHEAKEKRTWLCFTVRNDCFLHYLALPPSADSDLSTALSRTTLSSPSKPIPDWTVLSFNTNPNPQDLHVSYSLLSLSLHPSNVYICVQTGDHSSPSSTSSSSTAPGSLSRLLLFQPLSGVRAATVWTGVPTSSYAVPRHSWLPSGRGVWLNAEDGVLRLVDLKGRTRASVLAHGVAAEERDAAASWSRGGGGNTIIKDVVALGEAEVASCGFDRTVRITTIDPSILSP